MAKKFIVLSSGTSWVVPSDWNSTNNTIHLIGGGGGGGVGTAGVAGGAGGGGYTKITNFAATAGQSISYTIGAGGGSGGSGAATSFNSGAYSAGGGTAGTATTAGVGGTGTTYNGGSSNVTKGGGGGAAGPYGAGGNASTTASDGGVGGGGFGGSSLAPGMPGSLGGPGNEILAGITTTVTAGSGGGGGAPSGPGGLYGGGGAFGTTTGGNGAQGVIVIVYSTTYFNSPDGDLEDIFVKDYDMIDQYAMTGSLWTWGDNTYGALGDNTTLARSSPIQTISGGTNWKQVSCGNVGTAAIKTDGTLWTWGYNINGQLGDNTTIRKSSPVQTISGGTNWKQVSYAQYSTAAIKTDGTLWTWGYNFYGQLGDNTTIRSRSSPIQTISGGTNWKLVSSGSYCTAAIKTDGTLWAWGLNNNGQLGDNTTIRKSSPVQTISGGANWKQVSCGNGGTAAIKTDGTLWTWGRNFYGQLGDNTTLDKSSPVQTISGGANWKQVLCSSFYYTAAIKTDGTLWTWGYNFYGQLGDNTTLNKSSPVQTISGGTNWKQVSCGDSHTAAIKTDGTIWLWGNGSVGRLGDNTTITRRSSPIQTVSGGTNWKQVSAGTGQTAAIYYYDAGNLYPNQ